MDFDLQWILLALPISFGLGWLASRFDLRQWRREQRDSPRAYTKGLNLLLNEQHDKAIDAFIEAVQQDPDTSDLHFALGNLFRRRGEYERAVRVHEHLLQRADLPRSERDRAQHALAQDFMKAGLFDRAEQAYQALDGTAFDTEARLALLTLHERSRGWHAAVEVAQRLERSGTGSFATRIAHYWCELALEAQARRQPDDADDALRRAREAAPLAPRPLVLAIQAARARGDHAQAMTLSQTLLATQPAMFTLVAADFAASAMACGESQAALRLLLECQRQGPSLDLLQAIATVDPEPGARAERVATLLREQHTLSAAQALIEGSSAQDLDAPTWAALGEAVGRAARPLRRYRCAACGFEAQLHFWQCPGCLGWDTYPPQRIEEAS
jgi:lipopolysaccharide biosynthesis regulator YciM